ATLSGYARVESPLGYPFILPRPGATVRGVLLLNVDPVSLAQLDAYEAEGDLYRRQVVMVAFADRQVSAVTYVGHGIRASVTSMAARRTDLCRPESLSDARASTRGLGAPFADEH
ncbi:MAG: gamma-glutamylcyclotransferase, partial [Candidatus Tectomicrobia bacterium]|nr:gamma-glutamylcyclotransferase [Candidatus Tectomicrobia bacterium]